MRNQLLREHYFEIIKLLGEKKIDIPRLPEDLRASDFEGEAYAIAYPIQGLLKYHGMANTEHRIANFPSISLNNNCALTQTYALAKDSLTRDHIVLNNKLLKDSDPEYSRIFHQLEVIRNLASVNSKFLIISRNIDADNQNITSGKGLGTSASGGAAIAAAISKILYASKGERYNTSSVTSHFARYLAGSATRSAVGGVSLWLTHPEAKPEENYSVRLNPGSEDLFNKNWALITVSIPADIKTDQAHRIAMNSPFYPEWAHGRKKEVFKFIRAWETKDFDTLGKMAEYDTMCLHSITMTADKEKSMVLWSPETIKIIRYVHLLRESGNSVYFSIDTGPSVVLLTKKGLVKSISNELREMFEGNPKVKIILGHIGGEAKAVNKNAPLLGNFQKYIQENMEVHSK